MKLQPIGKATKRSLQKANSISKEPTFTHAQIDFISEAVKAAFEEYNNQLNAKEDLCEDNS